MPKTDKVEYERRLLTVQGWLIEGSQYALILKNIVDQGWCKDREAKRMIAKARNKWIDYEDENQEKKKRFKIQELKHLKRSLAAQYKGTPEGIKAILAVEKEIIKLEGLSAVKKIEVAGDDDKPPIQIKHTKSNVDYTKLSKEVLLAIVAARKTLQDES
ncbi:MAG: hypothetical protein WC756_12215 [Taibaiella sp.]|jgi:hypothetical protein